ncbi:porin family protein [Methyloglobulus sp.]|uniref:porin family protein n=1 Tax=Methyloglobulus sp. TaxID=2518622 RepID=UPI0039897671
MMNKTKLILGIATATLTAAGAMVTQQAVASTRAQHHVNEAALMSKVDVLEAQLRAMQDEMAGIRAASGQGADQAKVQELDTWMQESKANPVKTVHDNMIFFRGGFARNDSKRNDLLTGNQFGGELGDLNTGDIVNVLGGGRTNKDGYYVGAGFDFGLTDDVWGLMDDTEVDAELMFEYKNFGSKKFNNNPLIVTNVDSQNTANTPIPVGNALGNATGPAVNINSNTGPLCTLIHFASQDEAGPGRAGSNACGGVTVTQFSLTAAPKIKFMKGSAFRPWIIPIGLALHVISPPSNGVTVLNPGMMFGAGAEYQVWKAMHVGADVRYHLTGRSVDGVNTDGLTAGGYLGIGF